MQRTFNKKKMRKADGQNSVILNERFNNSISPISVLVTYQTKRELEAKNAELQLAVDESQTMRDSCAEKDEEI